MREGLQLKAHSDRRKRGLETESLTAKAEMQEVETLQEASFQLGLAFGGTPK